MGRPGTSVPFTAVGCCSGTYSTSGAGGRGDLMPVGEDYGIFMLYILYMVCLLLMLLSKYYTYISMYTVIISIYTLYIYTVYIYCIYIHNTVIRCAEEALPPLPPSLPGRVGRASRPPPNNFKARRRGRMQHQTNTQRANQGNDPYISICTSRYIDTPPSRPHRPPIVPPIITFPFCCRRPWQDEVRRDGRRILSYRSDLALRLPALDLASQHS